MIPTLTTRRTTVLAAAVLLFPIIIYAYAGRFSRFMADDYCYAIHMRGYGFPGVITYYYETWFGRITQIILSSASAGLGVGFGEILPALLLAIWLIGLIWLCRELAALLGWDRPTIYLGAALLLYATLAGTPQILHSLYWISSVFPYTLPLILLSYYVALVVRTFRTAHAPPLSIIASVVLALAAGMTCEPFSLAFVGGLAAGIVGVIYFSPHPDARRAVLALLIPNLIAAAIALAIMVVSPGNSLRESLFPPTHDPVLLATQSLLYTAAFIAASGAYFSPIALALTLLLPAVIAYRQPVVNITRRTLRLWIALAGLVAIGLIALTYVPAIYATSAPLPARVLITPQFVLVGVLAVIGYLLGLYIHKGHRRPSRLVTIGIGVLLAAGALLMTWNALTFTNVLSRYAAQWDAQEAQIVAAARAGERDVIVAPLELDVARQTGLDTIGTDAKVFPNDCSAEYYGVQSLRTSE